MRDRNLDGGAIQMLQKYNPCTYCVAYNLRKACTAI